MYFQIDVTPKAKKVPEIFKDIPESPAILVLGPFQPQTRLKLETNLYAEAFTKLIIKNPTNRILHVNITKRPPDERCISFSYSEVSISPNSESTLTLLWKPNRIGSWRDTLQLTDNRRIKYDVILTLICNKVQKGKTKCPTRSRVLTQSNKIRYVNVESIKVLLPSKVAMNEQNMKRNLNVNEENKENYRENINNDNLKTLPIQIYTIDSKIVTVNNLNISDFQLTSLNPCDNVKPVQIPQVRNIDATPKCSIAYDIEQSNNILEMSDSITKRKNDGNFMLVHESLSLKSIEKKSLLRRQTYLNAEPKFCKHMDSIDENFDDSLTPELFTTVRESTDERDFSMILNDIVNFTTPIKNISPATCSTSEKSTSSNVYDTNKSPKSTQNTGLIRPSKLTPIIEKMSSNTLFSNIPKINSSLSPEPIVDHQQMISIQSNDPSSAKAILEAKDANPHQASFLITNQENINHTLDLITEETVTVTKKITIEASLKGSEKYVTTLRKSSKFCVEISPPKKIFSNTDQVKSTKKLSPINHDKVMKDKSLAQHNSKSTVQDPFLNHRLYYDDEWILNLELEFTKWLNALLTPLEHNADVETACVDVGKVWQLCRAKENVILAETKEAVSARYHDTNARLYTLRKAACAMFMRDDVKNILAQVIACIEKGFFVIRQDRDLHRDIGLQKAILELLLSYNPLWLRIGLEVIYGEIIPLNSNNDLIGLTQFLIARFFSDPHLAQTYSHPYVINLKLPAFQPHMNQFLLTKFFSIVYFLDYAKRNKLIAHDPCLFHKKAINKDSRAILLAFSREVLSGVGDITKILRTHGYVVSYKQTYLDEYNYAVKNIGLDLCDGVRLCRLMELIIGDRTLTNQCRVPSISRLQKIHNVDLALNALIKAGYQITGDINAKSIKNTANVIKSWWTYGKLMRIERERFLKIQNSTIIIQRCWRRYRDTKNYISSFQFYRKATIIIQTWWRNLQRTKECQKKYLAYRRIVVLIQTRWREKILSRSTRQEYLKLKTVTIKIQSYWRMILVRRVYLNKLKQQKAAIVLQRRWRAKIIGREIHENYKKQKAAAILIQRKYRATKFVQSTRTQFLATRNSAIIIQKNWRMYKATVDYHNLKTATIIIQTQWRAQKLTITTRKSFVTLRNSAITIQRFYRAYCIGKIIRNKYIQYHSAVIRIQSTWRMIQARREYRSKIHAAIIIQRTWRRFIIARNIRNKFLTIRASAIIIQRRYRLNKMCKKIRQNYNELRSKVIWIQRRWRMIQARKKLSIEYKDELKRNNAAINIQAMWRGYKVRTLQSLEVRELRKRSRKAAKAATPSTTVEYRLKAAMNLLLNFRNIGQLTMCLACIDTLTRLSPKGCILFCELQLVERLYIILEKSNRSLPWMDVCKRCANILITLAKLPDTAKHVRNVDEMEIIARLMNTAIKYDVDLFLHLATLFWLLLNDPEFLLEVKSCERTIWLLRTLIVSVMKKENASMKLKNNKNISAASSSMLLPNTKPDWGLKARRPRCFTTIQQAISIIMEKLDISTS
ncbi:hypothetical protein PV326_009440 [Microctonus aethiopoides]|nr:hypothetical protein PV326_009440 [Microctonus aethiopoides]